MELSRFIKINELSTGRRLYALLRVLALVMARGLAPIVQLVEQAIAHDRQTRQLDLRWHAMRVQPRSPASVKPVDARVDRAIKALRDGAVAQAEGAAPDDPVHGEVEDFLSEVLPVGVFAITKMPYVEQLSELENIVEKLEGPLASSVAELGLQRQAARLSELLPQYRDAINGAGVGNLGYTTVREARKRGQRYLHEVIAMILGTYYRADDPEHQAARAELLGPIVEQNEAVRAYLRARRAVRDVDPETGDPEPETDAPATDEPVIDEPAA
jgi:hypothetical protein